LQTDKIIFVYKQQNVKHAKPFLKWAGGKGQLLEKFLSFYPPELKGGEIKKYCEPFIGGGAVFFDIVQRYKIHSAVLYDINKDLVLTYKVIQKDVQKLIENLSAIKIKYEQLKEEKRAEFYYSMRLKFNSTLYKTDYSVYSEKWIQRAAQIIFLNKTCFNGLFRFNSKGEFNVPAGRYKNPKILDEENLLNVSEILNIATIKNADFSEVEKDVDTDSFVYFDPPYRPLNATSGFTSYSKNKFGDAEQIKLAELFKRLNKKGMKLMLSNSDPKNVNPSDDFFDEMYKDFNITRIPATRMINSNASKRNAINEIVVTNYKAGYLI
jgi:DNA adenine methylase